MNKKYQQIDRWLVRQIADIRKNRYLSNFDIEDLITEVQAESIVKKLKILNKEKEKENAISSSIS